MKSRFIKKIIFSVLIFLFAMFTKHTTHRILQPKTRKNDKAKENATENLAQIQLKNSNKLNWGLQQIDLFETPILSPDEIIVAVIDTGIDTLHPALKEKLWLNKGELGKDAWGHDKASNGIDDDQNGYIDDIHGWNFVNDSTNLQDDNGHGTHISGIIAAKEMGDIRGIAPNAKIMVLKYYSPNISGQQNLNNTIAAIEYATQMGAHIINYSAGGSVPSELEKQAIRKAADKNILFIAAAGNNAENSDLKPFYPADYNLPNILSVTAINRSKTILPSSNFGSKTVDLAAPGHNIYSTLPKNKYGFLTGTSQATAFVSGLAALTWGTKKYYEKPQEVIAHLVASGRFENKLIHKSRNAIVLNSKRSIAMASLYSDAFGAPNTGNTKMYNFDSNLTEKNLDPMFTLEEARKASSLHQIKSWLFEIFL